MFLSTSEHALDAKNRVSAPAPFRVEVEDEAALHVFPHPTMACLEGGGEALIQFYRRSLSKMSSADPRRRQLEMVTVSLARRLEFDGNGRITLPREFIEHARLNGRVTFVGRGDRFEIWDSAAWAASLEEARRAARELFKDETIQHLFEGDAE